MKTEAAERMRQKLEKRLLPKLKVSLPQMAEKLRFLHMGQREQFVVHSVPYQGFTNVRLIPTARAVAMHRCAQVESPSSICPNRKGGGRGSSGGGASACRASAPDGAAAGGAACEGASVGRDCTRGQPTAGRGAFQTASATRRPDLFDPVNRDGMAGGDARA